ncbi:MAG: tyrosine-type recombinase/integrase [Patescibacteria group bacterium]|nr:tyrosine-type recombinase/integrase [Patescibacteria group bacterium]
MYNLERELKIRGFSRKTIKAYLHYNIKFLNNDENPYVFPGAQNKSYLSTRSAQKIVFQAAKLAGIKKDISCHNLRHNFATHLLEKGVDIRYIQKLLGHKRLETTQIYTQVSTQKLKEIGSPLDDL